jgi:NAD(P)H dehydrogenase (quinone)
MPLYSGLILVASATANTGSACVTSLSEKGAKVRAFVRKADDPRAIALAALPGVELFTGDMSDPESVASSLTGVSRCLLVSGAFQYEQFEIETLFIEAAAKAGVEVVVRISTASFLIKPGTKGAYGRTHHGIEAFAAQGKYPVVNLNPNWFMSNLNGNGGEAKATGKISLPVTGNGPKDFNFVDPRDVGSAAAAILELPSDKLAPFIAVRCIEVHGPKPSNLAEQASALSTAMGYEITINAVPRDAWAGVLIGYGVPRVFATSFLETVEQVDGVVPPGYESYGSDGGRSTWSVTTSSPELLAIGWTPKYDVHAWASSPATMAAFQR